MCFYRYMLKECDITVCISIDEIKHQIYTHNQIIISKDFEHMPAFRSLLYMQ